LPGARSRATIRTGRQNCNNVAMPVMKKTASVALGVFRAMAWDARSRTYFTRLLVAKVRKLGSDLGPISAENQRRRKKTTQSRPKQINKIVLQPLFRDQGSEVQIFPPRPIAQCINCFQRAPPFRKWKQLLAQPLCLAG